MTVMLEESGGVVMLRDFYAWCGKRALDVVVALALLVVLAPVLMVIALAVLLVDGRPILFRQKRLGRRCHPFRLHEAVRKGLRPALLQHGRGR